MANIYDMADTWNEGSTTFTAIKMNVVDTASAADSLLMDLQVGGVSQFNIGKGTGPITFEQGSAAGRTKLTLPQYSEISPENARIGISAGTNVRVWFEDGITVFGRGKIGFSAGLNGTSYSSTTDVTLRRDGPGILAQREGTNAQTFNLYNTYTDASNYERGFMRWAGNELEIGTVSAGTGGNRSVGIYSNNVRYQIIGSNFNQFDKNLYMNGANIVTGGAGFKIGTAANQPIGFWNATPVVQPTTGISAGSFVANTSGISDDTATFDGYTIGQVVAALRQIGLLA